MEFDDIPEEPIADWKVRAAMTNAIYDWLMEDGALSGQVLPTQLMAEIQTCVLATVHLYDRRRNPHEDWRAWVALESQLHRLSRLLSDYYEDADHVRMQENRYPQRAFNLVSDFVSRERCHYRGTGTKSDRAKYWHVNHSIKTAKAYAEMAREKKLKAAANRMAPEHQAEDAAHAAHALESAGLDEAWAESVADGSLTPEEVASRWLNREQ